MFRVHHRLRPINWYLLDVSSMGTTRTHLLQEVLTLSPHLMLPEGLTAFSTDMDMRTVVDVAIATLCHHHRPTK